MAESRGIDSTRALWGGIAFSAGFVLLIWGAGLLWLEPGTFADRKPDIFMWYLWQLSEPTVWTRASVWIGYLAHQVSIWYLIWRAQTGQLKYSSLLHWENVAALGVNAFFITLHLVQTLVWYDGLAQDTPEWTSQTSVTIMLMAILVMENQRRGLAFGVKMPLLTEVGRTIRKYHGYYFSWAIIYTFWYHPMEITAGHLFGFAYMFLLLLQGSLFFTRMHVNRYWTIVAEVSVVAHAVMVAILAAEGWPRFFGGFVGMFVVTQMHGLGLSRRTRWMIGLGYLAVIGTIYAQTNQLDRIFEPALIPIIEFIGVALVTVVTLLLTRLFSAGVAIQKSIKI